MKEVFLYRCDRCCTVIAIDTDRGKGFYLDQCMACKDWADYDRVVIAQNSNMYKESSFFVEGEDGNTDTRTDKERASYERGPLDK